MRSFSILFDNERLAPAGTLAVLGLAAHLRPCVSYSEDLYFKFHSLRRPTTHVAPQLPIQATETPPSYRPQHSNPLHVENSKTAAFRAPTGLPGQVGCIVLRPLASARASFRRRS